MLEELVERFNTKAQARFYIEHMGGDFSDYEDAHAVYHEALQVVKAAIPDTVRAQSIERSYLPTFTFGAGDFVAAVGPDGLVVNIAKYLDGQPLVAINPDPDRIDGVLLPFETGDSAWILAETATGEAPTTNVTMANVRLNDGQSLYAVNDLYIGAASHVSARYSLRTVEGCEDQSSSGIIVSTGAGSTGWLKSVVTGAARLVAALQPENGEGQVPVCAFDWGAPRLMYSVREPFISKTSEANLVFGSIESPQTLEITSHMPQDGVIFSDGIESDYLQFNSGAIATVGIADRKLRLVTDT